MPQVVDLDGKDPDLVKVKMCDWAAVSYVRLRRGQATEAPPFGNVGCLDFLVASPVVPQYVVPSPVAPKTFVAPPTVASTPVAPPPVGVPSSPIPQPRPVGCPGLSKVRTGSLVFGHSGVEPRDATCRQLVFGPSGVKPVQDSK